MQDTQELLEEFLLDAGLISRAQMEGATRRARERGESLSDVLVSGGILSEDEVRRAVSHALGIPYVALAREDIDPSALLLLPEPLCRTHHCIAYAASERGVEVAFLDIAQVERVRGSLGGSIRILPRLTSREALTRALLLYQKQLKEQFDGSVESLLAHAASQGAAAVHLDPVGEKLHVRYRLGGTLYEAMVLSRERGEHVVRELKDRRGLRLFAIPLATGERLILRLVQEGRRGFTLEALGFHGEGLEMLERAIHRREGLVVITGQGVSTVLYSLLDILTHPSRALVSIERNVECRLPHVAQMETGGGISASAALRAALRQDPDVVALHDIEDGRSQALAAAASNRCLVLIGLRDTSFAAMLRQATPSPAAAPGSVASALVIHQRIARKLCSHCSQEYRLTRAEERALDASANPGRVLLGLKEEEVVAAQSAWKDTVFRNVGEGCGECVDGYKGFIGVQEIAYEGKEPPLTVVEDALFKAVQGQTSVEEVLGLVESLESGSEASGEASLTVVSEE